MINSTLNTLPVYTTRELRNFGLYSPYSLYQHKFTPQDNILMTTGALKCFPEEMYTYTVVLPTTLGDKSYTKGETVDVSNFDDITKKTLLKTGVIKATLKEKYLQDNTDIKVLIKAVDCIGLTYKSFAEINSLDFDLVKEHFELGKGSAKAKVKFKDLDKLLELLK